MTNTNAARAVAKKLMERGIEPNDGADGLVIGKLPTVDQMEIGKAVIASVHEPIEFDPDRYLAEGAGAIWLAGADYAETILEEIESEWRELRTIADLDNRVDRAYAAMR